MLRRAALLGVLSIVIVACSAETESPLEPENIGTVADELTTSDAVSRAQQWVSVKLHYCQAPNGGRDYDAACTTYCNRQANPKWDPYRSDCSGLVSWAWNLPAPGRVTGQFAPFQTDITHAIPAANLKEGDAINNSDHIMLFKEWVTPGTKAIFLEEPGCSSTQPYARATTTNVTISGNTIHVASNGMTFTAIRNNALKPPPATPPSTPSAPATGTTEPPEAPPPAATPDPTPAPEPFVAPPPAAEESGCSIGSRSPSSPLGAAIFALVIGAVLARRRRD